MVEGPRLSGIFAWLLTTKGFLHDAYYRESIVLFPEKITGINQTEVFA